MCWWVVKLQWSVRLRHSLFSPSLSVVSITSLDGSTDERRADGYVVQRHVQMTSAYFSEFLTPSFSLSVFIGITQPPFLSSEIG